MFWRGVGKQVRRWKCLWMKQMKRLCLIWGALKWCWISASGNLVLLFCAPPCNYVYMGTILIHPFLLTKSNLIENITSLSNTEMTSFTYNNICAEYIFILSYSGTSICQCFVCAEQCTESQNYSFESQINYFTFF